MLPYRYIFSLAFCCLLSANVVSAQRLSFVIFDTFPELATRIQQAESNPIVVHFWATWCNPCLGELHLFEEIAEKYAPFNLEVLLVSLDFRNELTKFATFVEKRNFQHVELAIIADQSTNDWMPLMSESWSGAVPATFIYRGASSSFRDGVFSDFEDLESFILPLTLPAYAPRE